MQEHGAPRGLQVPGSTWDERTAPSDTGWCKYRYQGAAGAGQDKDRYGITALLRGNGGNAAGYKGIAVRTQNEKEERWWKLHDNDDECLFGNKK